MSTTSQTSSSRSFTMQVFGTALMVTGTCIGAGMLGLPVLTAAGGLLPTTVFMSIVWLVMMFTALLMLEASLFLPGETNFISMATSTLGVWGGRVAWVAYIFFLYSLMAAYTSGGTTMLADAFNMEIDQPLELLLMTGLFVLPFAFFVYHGAKWVDYVNRLFIIGLIACFCLFSFNLTHDTTHSFNLMGQGRYLIFTLPLLTTTFGFHLLVPTLKTYLREDVAKLRLAIILGSFIPFLIYWVWVFVVFQRVPAWGENGLVSILTSGNNPGEFLIHALANGDHFVLVVVTFFTFFALISSFIGVGLGISDFFSDGLKIRKSSKGRMLLALLTFGPPAVFTFFNPRGFLFALGYAGIFAAILLIVYPALMCWSGRYIQSKAGSSYQVIGGKLSLVIAIMFGLLVIVAEVLDELSLLPVPSV